MVTLLTLISLRVSFLLSSYNYHILLALSHTLESQSSHPSTDPTLCVGTSPSVDTPIAIALLYLCICFPESFPLPSIQSLLIFVHLDLLYLIPVHNLVSQILDRKSTRLNSSHS